MASDKVREAAGALCDYLDETSGGAEWKGAPLVRRLRAALAAPSGGDATPRDEAVEPVAWAVVRANGTRDYVYQQEESAAASVARLNAETDEGFIVANQPYRVVALVPQKGGAR